MTHSLCKYIIIQNSGKSQMKYAEFLKFPIKKMGFLFLEKISRNIHKKGWGISKIDDTFFLGCQQHLIFKALRYISN